MAETRRRGSLPVVNPENRLARRTLPALGGLAAFSAAYWGVAVTFVPPGRRAVGRFVLWHAPGDRRAVALTFDDGPDRAVTRRLLAALGDVPATFFWLGSSVRRWPWLAREAAARGHELACHGDDHRPLAALGPRATVQSLRRARDSIGQAAGVAPRFYRPAYGVFNAAAWVAAPRLGMRRTLWSRWARDWEARATPPLIASRILRGARPGGILLLHDADGSKGAPDRTLAALPAILAGIRERGLRPVTLSQLVAADGCASANGASGG
jgi:peptidoglycan-N-acetylglucosamine deacetylase